MDDLIKPADVVPVAAPSASNAREVALELSFDQSAFDSLDGPAKKKKRKTGPTEESPAPVKKPKVAEVEGVDPVLLALQMKKNEARAIARKATGEEEALQAAGPYAQKHKEAAEEKAKQREFQDKLKAAGVDPERYGRLHETQETVDAAERRKNRRGASDSTSMGPSVDQYASSFARRSRDVVHDRTAYEAQKEALGDDFYSDVSTASVSTFKPDSARVDAMVAELDKQGQKRREFHRRRTFKEEKDITFINEANRKFNKQLEKQYGKATAAIKESLERGSAL